MRANRSYRTLARTLRDTAGAALVEFTIMAPFLIFLGLGVGEFGRALQHHHVMDKGVRDAARYLARVPVTCPGGTVDNGADVATARNLAITGQPSGGTPRLPYWTDPSTVTVTVDCFDNSGGDYRGQASIPLITVTATVDYEDVGFLAALGLGAMTFTARHQQLHIGE